jgi:hypothetical protein
MKKSNWTCLPIKKYIATVCASSLLSFTLSAGAGLIAFDELPNTTTGLSVPPSYQQLVWSNFGYVNGVDCYLNPSGYQKGVKSRNNVVYNSGGAPASISVGPGGSFVPLSAYVTAAWNDNLQMQVEGYLRGRLVFSMTYKLSATKPTPIKLGGRKVDELVFTSFGGTPHSGYPGSGEHFALDNLQVTSLNPGTMVPAIIPEGSSKNPGAAGPSTLSE